MDDNAHCNGENPVLHVLVVGFHHKKGCQVEYSFPPLVPCSADESECPPGWKYLPTLALPDGSHNYDEDTVFFHLPSLTDPDKSVFGISCFRQIPVEKLKNRTADITRGTVQKSVCVLSRVPLYGQIQVKMALITHAYFEEGDFTKVSLLSETYHHLNACISQHIAGDDYDSTASQLFVGLSGRDLILHWRHKALLLFKLLLLERKVVFYKSPVRPLCSTILSLLSLHPGMIETGLYQSACIQPSRPMSPVPQFDEVRAKQHQQENSCREKETNRLVKDENDKDEQKTRDAEGRLKGATEEEEEAKKDERRGGDEENCVERLSYDLMKKEGDEQRRKGVDEGERAVKEEENACGKGMDKQVQDDSQTDIEQQNRVQESNADATENGCSKFDKEDSNCYHDSEQIKKNGYIDGLITNETKREERIDVIRNKGRGGMVMNRNVKTERPISSGRMETSLEMAREAISDDNVGGGGVVTFQSRRRGSNDVITADDDYDDDDGEQVTIASLPRDVSVETLGDVTAQNNIAAIAPIDALACGLPLAIFTEGYLCMPYLSLPYLDLLSDQNVRGYVVGATNVLFKQKKRLADVLVEVDGARIEVTAGGIGGVVGGGAVQDGAGAMASAAAAVELRRQLHLSTEDLRFADYLVRHVAPPVTGGGATVATTSCATTEAPNVVDVFVDGVGWEGGDEWLRNQFRVYMLCLLRTSLLPEGSRELDQFNAAFIAAWRRTRSYELWLQQLTGDTSIWNLHPGHPFAGGQLSVADMKLRITHTMQNTEGGRKLNQAMVSTGRAVATTGRAVGGAISQAKGALSSWWSNLTTAQSPTEGGPPPLSLPGGQKGPATENGEHSQKSADSEDSSRAKVEDTALASSSVFEV